MSIYFFFQKWMYHFTFKTHFYDLFFYNHAIWNISKTLTPWISPLNISFLEDHFYFWLYAVAPFYKIISTPLILFAIQSMCLYLTGLPIIKLAKEKFGSQGAWVTLLLLGSYVTFRRAIFDAIHGEFFMMALLSWIIYWMVNKQHRRVLLLSCLLIFAKENAFTLLVPLGALFWFENKKKIAIGVVFLAVICGYMIFNVFFHSEETYSYLLTRYDLGVTFFDSLIMIIKNPLIILKKMISFEKLRYIILLFLPLAGLSFFSKYLILGIPLLLQNLLSTRFGMVNVVTHYSFPLIPIIFMSAILSYHNLKHKLAQYPLVEKAVHYCSILFVVLNIGIWLIFDFRHFYVSKDIIETRQVLKQIATKDNLSILSTPNLIQFFSYSQKSNLIRFPKDDDNIDYVVLANQMPLDKVVLDGSEYLKYFLKNLDDIKFNTYRWFYGEREYSNLASEPYSQLLNSWKSHPNYHTILNNSEVLVLKRVTK